ncbi:MAG TPA: hypothetical protein VJ327_09750 [Patescibacteria group bacterium]|nr:hypothetical protein [Patescibacteria group bacterium]
MFYWGIKYQGFSKSTTAKQDTPQFLGTLTYVNQIANYSFQYSSKETVGSAGGYEGPPEKSDIIVIDDKATKYGLMSIELTTSPTGRYLKNEQEALNEIVGYWESSTSRYLTPELNKVTGPIQTTIGDNATDSQSALAYKYEIAWRNDPKYSEGGSGIDVWLFIPITVDWQSDPERLEWFNEEEYVFLWLQYDKKDEKHLLPILNTFALYPKSSYGQ